MEKLYFTFGSDPKYPYGRGEYVLVLGSDKKDCIAAFEKKYPRRAGSDCINCADYYDERKNWTAVKNAFYPDTEPADRIISDAVYGKKPDNFNPLWIFVPAFSEIIFIQEGSGDNLSHDDLEEGYVDYLDCTSYKLGYGEVEETGGGMLLLKECVQEKYACLSDAIPDILEDLYNDPYREAQIISEVK